MDDFLDDFKINYKPSTPRKCYRMSLENLYVKTKDTLFQGRDISCAGVSFFIPKDHSFQLKETLEIELILENKTLIKTKAKVVRIKDNYLACAFENLSLREERLLDKIVLEAQKKELEAKKLKEKESEIKDEEA